jgi:metal-responsive CopG/Arc/MetJ family transcriptional regulator
MAKRIQVVLQDTTVSVLDRITTKGTRSRFIDHAVRHFVQSRGKKILRERLEAGYRANAGRDLSIAAEWFPLEQEAFGKFETRRTAKTVSKIKRK